MKPLLIFPKARPTAIKLRSFKPAKLVTPSSAAQYKKLSYQLNNLEKSFLNGIISDVADGVAPERTLVLETNGEISDFCRAIEGIPGLEFINEVLDSEAEPDEDFYFTNKDGDKTKVKLKRYIYLAMSNQKAMQELLHLWKQCSEDESYIPRHGLAPLKSAFLHLKSVRYWDIEDRLRETGLEEDWTFRKEHGDENIPVEVELWYRHSHGMRMHQENRIIRLVHNLGGQILNKCTIPEIAYHSILAVIPISAVDDFISEGNRDVDLLMCDDIMFFRPVGQCSVPVNPIEDDVPEEKTGKNNNEISSELSIAVFDGMPLSHHMWIKDHLYIDDPDGYSSSYKANEQCHATAMLSLIVHGDKSENETTLNKKIYVRPILNPSNVNGEELIPEGVLVLDLIHRAVRRLFEPEQGDDPIAPNVKVINLSVADRSRLFDNRMSPWARLIDWLSFKYQVLFVISTGNHTLDIELDIENEKFEQLNASEKENEILKAVFNQMYDRRLMSPSESINAISVGGLHHDASDESTHLINPYVSENMPSPVNTISWGRKRSIKPDILMSAGRQLYRNKTYTRKDPARLTVFTGKSDVGHKVASPGAASGALNGYTFTNGTSNAAAMATRRLGFLLDTIRDLYLAEHGNNLDKQFESVLLKAMLVHGAESSEHNELLVSVLKNKNNSRMFKASVLCKVLGYGRVNEKRIHGCEENQVTVLQCGAISDAQEMVFQMPLPDSLISQAISRRLIITLAWFSPIKASSYKYRESRLWFDAPGKDSPLNHLACQNRALDHNMVKSGTIQHEVLFGDKAAVYKSGTTIDIKVNCKIEKGQAIDKIPFGLVVTVDLPDAEIDIYDEVSKAIVNQHIPQVNV